MSGVKNFVGIDLGKRMMEVVRLGGVKIERLQTKTDSIGEARLLGWVTHDDVVAIEAGNQAFRIAKALKRRGYEVVVLNPGDLAMIYDSLKKTDKEDALKLARLIQRIPREELPVVSVPTDAEEDARRLCTEQEMWSNVNTVFKNRLHALFAQAGLTNLTKADVASKVKRQAAMKRLPERFIEEATRLDGQLLTIESGMIAVTQSIKSTLRNHGAYVQMAMSMTGIGLVNTLTLLAYVGDGSRFSSAKQVSHYAGLVPRVDQSGDTVRYGHITKRGNTVIRRNMNQAAWALVRSKHGGPLKGFYERLAARRGKKVAIVALSRKMLETLYVMFRTGELYRDIPELVTARKLAHYGLAA